MVFPGTGREEYRGNMRKLSFLTAVTIAAGIAVGTGTTAQAEDPGKVVVYAPAPYELNDRINEEFTKKTGIEVEAFNGTAGEILSKLEGEKENPSADVLILASWTDGLALADADLLMSPEPEGYERLIKTFTDEKKMLFGYAASAAGVIYNTSIYGELKEDWKELSEGDSPAMTVITDPSKSGSSADFITGFINSEGEGGWKILKKLSENGMTVAGTSKSAFDSVVSGEKGILLGAPDNTAYEAKEEGLPIDVYYPKSGTVLNPRPAMILNSAPDAENAKLYLEFLLSDDVQKMVEESFLIPGVEGFKSESGTSSKNIPLLKYDWKWIEKNSGDVLKKFKEMTEASAGESGE